MFSSILNCLLFHSGFYSQNPSLGGGRNRLWLEGEQLDLGMFRGILILAWKCVSPVFRGVVSGSDRKILHWNRPFRPLSCTDHQAPIYFHPILIHFFILLTFQSTPINIISIQSLSCTSGRFYSGRLIQASLECVRKLDHPAVAHAVTGKTCKPYTDTSRGRDRTWVSVNVAAALLALILVKASFL